MQMRAMCCMLRANQFGVCENWQLKLCRRAGVIKKIKARWRSLGILLLGNILCEYRCLHDFYMSTSNRFVVYILHERCQGKQNIVGLNRSSQPLLLACC